MRLAAINEKKKKPVPHNAVIKEGAGEVCRIKAKVRQIAKSTKNGGG